MFFSCVTSSWVLRICSEYISLRFIICCLTTYTCSYVDFIQKAAKQTDLTNVTHEKLSIFLDTQRSFSFSKEGCKYSQIEF